jgi:hypothetical protein
MSEIIKKKRGRKPKSLINTLNVVKNTINEENQNTEEEKIILHLPVSANQDDMSVFINTKDSEIVLNNMTDSSEYNYTNSASNSNSNLPNMNVQNNNNYNNLLNNISHSGKITTCDLKFNKNTKCWWCKYSFESEPIQLPEDYYNDIFYCIGHFCSYNCAKSYNIDCHDYNLSSKRNNLLHLLYYQTYTTHSEIIPAPHWLALKDFGGLLNITEFRNNSITNNKEYLLLQPPITSRQMQIEESYKLKKMSFVPIGKVNEIYSDKKKLDSEIDSDFYIKRTKSSKTELNLETTMGLIKKK